LPDTNEREFKLINFAKNPNFEVVCVDDIAIDDLSAILKGVKCVVHTASPLAGRATAAEGLKSAVDGTMNILKQAFKAGITKFVLTSSWATTMDPTLDKMCQGVVLTGKDWGTVSEAELLSETQNPFWNYLATKILAESAAWTFAQEHPTVDLCTINPPFIFGPPHPDFPPVERERLGTNGMIYALINGEPGRDMPPQFAPFYCDVRDVAMAHVRSLNAKPLENGQKRLLVCGGSFMWKEAVEHLNATRPDLKHRLPSPETAKPLPGTLSTTDVSPASAILGLENYIPWTKCVTDTLDALLVAEKEWK